MNFEERKLRFLDYEERKVRFTYAAVMITNDTKLITRNMKTEYSQPGRRLLDTTNGKHTPKRRQDDNCETCE